MADQTTNYVIQVADKVAPTIEPKIVAISTAATNAGTSISGLQAQLDKLNAAGLSAIGTSTRDANTASRALNTTTQTTARSANAAAQATTNFANALPRLTANARAANAALQPMVTAMGGFAAVSRVAAASSAPVAAATANVGQAATSATGGVRGFSSVLGFARGNLMSANYQAGRFLSTLVGSGPIVQAAFSVIGALALVAVLVQIGQAVGNVVIQYRALSDANKELATSLAISAASGEEQVKAQTGIGEAASRTLAYIRGKVSSVHGETIVMQTASGTEKQQAQQDALLSSQNQLNEAGLKSAALAKQKQKDIQAEIDLTNKQIVEMKNLRDESIGTAHDSNFTDAQRQAANKQATSAESAIGELYNKTYILANQKAAQAKIDSVDQLKDDAKAARAEMTQLTRDYNAYITTTEKQTGSKVTPVQSLAWWENAAKGLKYYSTNIELVEGREKDFENAITSRNDSYVRSGEVLDEQIADIGAYSDKLKEQVQLNKLNQEFQKTGIPLTQAEIAARRAQITEVVESADYMHQLGAEYTAVNGPQREFLAQQNAIITLLNDKSITDTQAGRQLALATNAYKDSQDPMREYQHNLALETQLLGQYGTQLSVATQVQAQQQRLIQTKGYSSDQAKVATAGLEAQLTALAKQKQIQGDVEQLYDANAGALEKLTNAQLANVQAYQKQIISATQYKEVSLQTAIAQNDLLNVQGKGNFGSQFEQMLSAMRSTIPLAQQLRQSFTQFFTTLTDGFADAIGHVVAFGGSMSKALLDTARQAVAGLISSLIKLGIQYLITTALMKLFNIQLPKQQDTKSTVAGTTAAISSIAAITAAQMVAFSLLEEPAWSLAEAVSLITFGANAAAATAGIASVVAVGDAQKFSAGGRVFGSGTSTSDSIPAMLSNGEYVVNASAYSAHRQAVEAINNGARSVYSVANSSSSVAATGGSVGGRPLNVNVVHDGSTAIEVVRGTSPDEVQLIAKNAVYTHADDVIGQSMANPNSRTRKMAKQHTTLRGQS